MRRFSLMRLAACLIACTLAMTGHSSGAETGDLAKLRQKALELVNKERRDRDLQPLTLGPALNEAAQRHAEDMLARNYYAHVSPEGDTVRDRYLNAGGNRWELAAENIARCQSCDSPPTEGRIERLHQGWMNSPEHRENILRHGLERLGFGIVVGEDQTLYAVQTFAGPGSSRGAQPEEDTSAIGQQQQNALAARRLDGIRKREGAPPVEPAPALAQAAANLLPEQDLASFDTARLDALAEALPDGARAQWGSLAVLMGSCSGCGAEPNAADIRSFFQQWLDDPQYRSRLLDQDFTHFGFIVRANGEGLKTALLVLGRRR